MRFALSVSVAALSTFAAAQDISIIASSCAANDFLAAAGAPGNPCKATDYVCQCTTGKQFTQDYLTKALTADPGTCTPDDISKLAALGEQFCASVPGVDSSSSSSSATSSASGTSTMASSATSNMASTPTSTPASTPSTFAGAGTKQAVGGVAGMIGAAALFVL